MIFDEEEKKDVEETSINYLKINIQRVYQSRRKEVDFLRSKHSK